MFVYASYRTAIIEFLSTDLMITKCIYFLIVAYTSYIYGQNETELCGEDSFNEEGDLCRGALRLVEESQVSEML